MSVHNVDGNINTNSNSNSNSNGISKTDETVGNAQKSYGAQNSALLIWAGQKLYAAHGDKLDSEGT